MVPRSFFAFVYWRGPQGSETSGRERRLQRVPTCPRRISPDVDVRPRSRRSLTVSTALLIDASANEKAKISAAQISVEAHFAQPDSNRIRPISERRFTVSERHISTDRNIADQAVVVVPGPSASLDEPRVRIQRKRRLLIAEDFTRGRLARTLRAWSSTSSEHRGRPQRCPR